MATVYSLVCFGGLSGKTVTFTDAGDVVNLTNHGLRQGVTGVVFSTTGTLPTGITAGTTYYPRDGADANKFTIYPTKADALAGTNQRTFTGTGSGTHTVKSAYMLGLTAEQLARYGNSGSERIYNGLLAWVNARNPATSFDTDEVCEVGETYTDINSSLTYSVLSKSATITSMVNGVRSAAFHGGLPGSGYIYLNQNSGSSAIFINGYYHRVDGIEIIYKLINGASITTGALACFVTVSNCIFQGDTSKTGQKGLYCGAPGDYYNNMILNIGGTGVLVPIYAGVGARFYNNIVTKCTGIGISAEGSTQGLTYNNISVGNTEGNWGTWPTQKPAPRHHNNAGEPADKLTVTVSYATNANNITFPSAHRRVAGLPIIFTSSGTLPTVVATGQPLVAGAIYYVKTNVSSNVITISATDGGTVLAFSDNGTGTHYTTAVWSNDGSEKYLDLSTNSGNDVFINYSGNDFRPAETVGTPNVKALQVDNGISLDDGVDADIKGDVRPNYEAATYPTNYWDVGPFEFDHGNGLAPQQVTLSISGMTEGSILAVYKTSDGSAIISPTTIGASGSHSTTYSYTGNVQITVVVRKGTSGTKYLPYSAPGLITSTGFSLIVNQVPDGVLNG